MANYIINVEVDDPPNSNFTNPETCLEITEENRKKHARCKHLEAGDKVKWSSTSGRLTVVFKSNPDWPFDEPAENLPSSNPNSTSWMTAKKKIYFHPFTYNVTVQGSAKAYTEDPQVILDSGQKLHNFWWLLLAALGIGITVVVSRSSLADREQSK